jgi:WD40 repeat protein
VIAIATDDGTVRIEDLAGDPPVFLRHDAPARALAIADGGAWIATGADRVVRVWARDGALRHELRGHRGDVVAVAVDAGGGTVVSAEPGGARRWALGEVGAARLGGPGPAGLRLATGDGWLAAVDAAGAVWRWEPGATAGTRLGAHAAAATGVAISGDGRVVVTGGDDRTVRAWPRDGEARVLGAHGGAVRTVALASDGARAASGGDDRAVRLWSLGDGAEQVVGRHGAPVIGVAFTGDGRRLVSIADEPVAWTWDLDGGPARRLELAAAASALAVAPGGAVAIGTRGGEVVLWPAGGAATVVARHDGPVRDLAFDPDGRQVASAGDDGRVIVARAGAAPRILSGHDDFAVAVAFAPDGRTVASGGEDGTVRLWDVGSGEGRALPAGGWVADVTFADRGDAVIATGADGVVRRWRDELPRDAAGLRAALAAILAAAP